MFILSALLLICQSFAAWGTLSTTGDFYDCSSLGASSLDDNNFATKKEQCLATGWCFWQGFKCYYDNCLLSVPDATWDGAPTALAACGNGGSTLSGNSVGSTCGVYYLTGVPACSAGQQDSITDIYCRESNAAFEHKIIDLCFYNDLKWRNGNGDTPYTAANAPYQYNSACVPNGTGGTSSYTYKDESRQDCSLLANNAPELCKCLGKDRCNLHPNCTLSKDGSSCIVDPCNPFTASNLATANLSCTNSPAHCKVGNVWRFSSAGNVVGDTICVTDGSGPGAQSNLDYNECFFAYKGESTKAPAPYDIYPECDTPAPKDACTAATSFDGVGALSDPPVKCTLEPLQAGWFPLNNYCYDGSSKRSLPSPGAASIIRIPSVIAFTIMAFISLLLA